MTEQKKWRVGDAEYGGPKLIYDEDDRQIGEFNSPADAARIVALNNAEGGDASSKDQNTAVLETSCSAAAGVPNFGGGVPVAWQWQAGDGTWQHQLEAEEKQAIYMRNTFEGNGVRPLYAAPVARESTIEVSEEVDRALENLRSAAYDAGYSVSCDSRQFNRYEGKKRIEQTLSAVRTALVRHAQPEIILMIDGTPVSTEAIRDWAGRMASRPEMPDECHPTHARERADA